MNYKKIFIASLFLLAIIAIGAVSASEDIANDEVTAIEPTDDVITESVDEPIEEIVTESVEEEPVDEAIGESVNEIQSNDDGGTSEHLGNSYIVSTNTFDVTLSDLNVNKEYYYKAVISTITYKNDERGHLNYYVNGNLKFTSALPTQDEGTRVVSPVMLGINDYGDYNIRIELAGSDIQGYDIGYDQTILEQTVTLSNPGSFDVDFSNVITSSFYEEDADKIIIRINSESTQTGSIHIFVDGNENKSFEVTNGKIDGKTNKNIILKDLGMKSGIYNIKVTFTDNEFGIEEQLGEQEVKVYIYSLPQFITTNIEQAFTITMGLPAYVTGTITVYNGTRVYDKDLKQYNYTRDINFGSADIIDGKATLELPLFAEGRYNLIVDFPGLDGTQTEWMTFSVLKNWENITVSVSSEIEEGNDAVVNFKALDAGTLFIRVDKNEEKLTEVSSTVYTIPNLSLGTHSVRVLFITGGNYVYIYTFTVNVIEKKPVPAKIVAKDLTAYYNKGTYSVTVYGTDGKVAKNTNVVFKINGKKIATVKTNSKGIAKVKIPTKYVPKTYKISATALGKTVTKKLVVKQVLTLKKVTVKKSAKKLVITATLKEGKKAIKAKKITFKFNGKKYTATTNKKGIAKITIKKAVLKKLKVNKKITYQATYLKDTAKRTVKVKK